MDLVGVVVCVGGWEREACRWGSSGPTGQYWVRVWLRLTDHSAVDAVTGTASLLPVRIFVDGDRCVQVLIFQILSFDSIPAVGTVGTGTITVPTVPYL